MHASEDSATSSSVGVGRKSKSNPAYRDAVKAIRRAYWFSYGLGAAALVSGVFLILIPILSTNSGVDDPNLWILSVIGGFALVLGVLYVIAGYFVARRSRMAARGLMAVVGLAALGNLVLVVMSGNFGSIIGLIVPAYFLFALYRADAAMPVAKEYEAAQ